MSHWNYFFENIISGIQLFYIRPDAPAEFLFSFRFSSRKSQSQQKLAKKISHFTIQFLKTSLILRTSTQLALKITCSRNTVKNLSDIKNFPAKMFLLGVRKNICTASFLDAQELHF